MVDRMDGMSRRVFLKVVGAATGAAASCSPAAAPEKLIPYLVAPENIVPGRPLLYRTVCRECGAGCGVTAKVREGRVIKLEGNPDDPIGRGALCARGQAALQNLYAPDRLVGPMRRGADGKLAPIAWDAAIGRVASAIAAARVKRGVGAVRMLTRSETGSAGALQRAFLESFGAKAEHRIILEPFDLGSLRAAGAALFGRPELPVHDLTAARTVVSFGADFLETWLSPVELTRQLGAGRGCVGEDRTRLWWIGPRLSLTGASSDRAALVRSGGERAFALGLLRWLTDPSSGVSGLAKEAPEVFERLRALDGAALARASGISWSTVVELGRELSLRRPSALLGPGIAATGPDATDLALLVQLLNYLLGNTGRTVLYGLDALADPPSSFSEVQALIADLAAGRVEVLLVHHADPVGALPAALEAAAALGHVPLIVSFSDIPDQTTLHAHLVLPDHHALESFGDALPRRGIVALCQPAMRPVADTKSASQALLEIAARLPSPAAHFPFADFYEYTQTRAQTYAMSELGIGGDLVTSQRAALERGGYYSKADPAPVKVRLEQLPPLTLREPAADNGELTLVAFPSALRHDGRSSAPWLRETPDVLSGIAWSSWAELSPKGAARLGISDGDLLELRTAAGRTQLPACIYPGLRDDAVAVPLGDAEPLALIPIAIDPRSGGLVWSGTRVSVTRTGRRVELARADAGPTLSSGGLLKTVRVAAPIVVRKQPEAGLAPPPPHPKHRWAMAIDLDRCTGCQSCAIACSAENNIPVLGPQALAQGRGMAWLQIQRFTERAGPDLQVDLLPMLCQQCSSAPCETVCPVYATYHTSEGLNAQVYNRCVGTRYCANNCPYKVRVFNFREPAFEHPLDWQLNPDVSVRSKGVMEKCTFCVQRIRFAENEARDERRPIRDGEIAPACAQTCPAQAIVFGDANDPSSRIAALQQDGRAFSVLEELNTRPAVTYLARVREQKP